MSVTRGFLMSLLLCLLGAAVALAQPVGPEFRVNTFTTLHQRRPSVASDAGGNFVVVWDSSSQDPQKGIFGQRYDSDGNPLGGEFRVNTYTMNAQYDATVASDAVGNFVVVWTSAYQNGSELGVFAQRYSSSGKPLGGEFRVNTEAFVTQNRQPSVASDASGNFVVAWFRARFGIGNDIFAQRFDSKGNPLGGEFQVNTFLGQGSYRPSVASDARGNFVIFWDSLFPGGPGGINWEVFGKRYDNQGNPRGEDFRVNAYTTDAQWGPSVASDAVGNFVVGWVSEGQQGVFGKRYDSEGNPLGGEFRVNTFTTGQYAPAVASNAVGNFVVVWESDEQDGSDFGIFGQRYDSHGNPLGGEFRVNTFTTNRQYAPAVASNAVGNFVVVWESDEQDGSSYGIFGQRFSAACEALIQVRGASQDVHTPGSTLRVRIHIAHNSPKTVTVPWELSLIDPSGQVVAERITPPHTFEPGEVVDRDLALTLPEDLEAGTYTLRLGISGMAGIEGATTSFQVVRAE